MLMLKKSQKLGVWRHEEYLERKALWTTTDDIRDIIPECLNVGVNIVSM